MDGESPCSSTRAAGTAGGEPVSFLERTLRRLHSTRCLKLGAEEEAPVAVVALQRYLSAEKNGQEQSYSYDVTVTDGVYVAKCLIHSGLNRLLETNTLRTGADFIITQCSFVYDEMRLGHGYICIERCRCGADSSVVLPPDADVGSLPRLVKQGMERSLELRSDAPLQLSRNHYLPLWNNDDPEGQAWGSVSRLSDTVLDVSGIAVLSCLEASFRLSQKRFPLLVRIIHKSRLRYYGKFGLKIDYPYQAYFEVADQSGIMSLVLWNKLCLEFYKQLNVGAVLYLQNYTLKQSYAHRSRPQMDHHKLKHFSSVEICLNPHSPTSIVTIMSPKSVLPQWGLPDVAYQFTTRSEMDKLPNNAACDVIGLVIFVGRVERVKSKGNKGPEKYWTYRWVHAVDGTSHVPFILEIFSSSQPEIFNSICPMTYLVCTQMRMCHVEGSLPYLTSSCETEMLITGYHKGQPYVSNPTVKSYIQWTKTLKDEVVLQKTAMGGHYCYPPPPRLFTQSVANTSVPLVAAADLQKELEMLQYREHKRLAIQGQITAVRYMSTLRTTGLQKEPEREVLGVSAERSEPDAQHHSSVAEEGSTSALIGEKRRRIQTRHVTQASVSSGSPPSKRRAGSGAAENVQGQEGDQSESEEEEEAEKGQDADLLLWESRSWSKQRQEGSKHLRGGGLCEDAVTQKFTFDTKEVLQCRSNLQPTHWTPQHNSDTVPPAASPGYYQVTILGINKQMAIDAVYYPVVSTDEPRAVGLPQDPHGNTMLSCLSSGFLCPLRDPDNSETALPEPEEILATADELDETHLVCVLDLCHLGGEEVEVVISKVYGVTDVSLS